MSWSQRRRGRWRAVVAAFVAIATLAPAVASTDGAGADPSDAVREAVDGYREVRVDLDAARDSMRGERARRDEAREDWEQASFGLEAAERRLAARQERVVSLSTEYYVRQGADDDARSGSIRLALSGSRDLVTRAVDHRDRMAGEEGEAADALTDAQVVLDEESRSYEEASRKADEARARADRALVDAGSPELPSLAFIAYRDATDRANDLHPECSLSTAVLAGIGMLTSGHSRDADGTIDHTGRVEASTGRAVHLGGLDAAVGPMQITEAAWSAAATDGNGDGAVSRKDLFDAAATTAEAMCASGTSLAEIGPLEAAVGGLFGEGQQTTVALGIARRYAGIADLDLGSVPDDPRELAVDGSPQFDPGDTDLVPADIAGMLAWAMTRIGTPYSQCLGPGVRPQDPVCPPGTNRFGVGFFDCSGFVSNAYRRIGFSLPLTTYAMEANPRFMSTKVSDRIDLSVMQPGDVFLMDGHTGMYVGGGMIIHAIGRGLTYEPVPRWVANGTIAVLRPVDLL